VDVRTQPDAPPGWDELARECGLFYHHPRWITGLSRTFGFPVRYVAAFDDARLVAGLPLAEVPSLIGPRRLVSLPFSYAAGVIGAEEAAHEALAAEAIAFARECRARRIEIKSRATGGAPTAYTRTLHYSTFRVPTSGGEAAVWSRLHAGSTRRSIRKGEKAGMRVVTGETRADWLVMAELQEQSSHGHGVPAPPRRFFVELCRDLQGHGLATLYLAFPREGRAAAGIVVWLGAREWIYAFGASRPETLEERPNHVLLWTALRDAIGAGVVFDLGRAAPEQTGLVEFKRRWGGEPTPLAYDYWPVAAGLNVAPRHRGTLGLAARVWSALPASIARRGSFLYRYLG